MVTGRADAVALGRDPHSVVNATRQEGLAMATDQLQLPRIRHTPQTESRTTLSACSLCLRVLRGSEWIEAERVIAEIRSYELDAPPRLEPAVCDVCVEAILIRRGQAGEPVAA
jgi:hypothetical protein